jgi:hypothetical protein
VDLSSPPEVLGGPRQEEDSLSAGGRGEIKDVEDLHPHRHPLSQELLYILRDKPPHQPNQSPYRNLLPDLIEKAKNHGWIQTADPDPDLVDRSPDNNVNSTAVQLPELRSPGAGADKPEPETVLLTSPLGADQDGRPSGMNSK